MSAAAILSELNRRGATVSLYGEKLRITPKAAALDLVNEIQLHKSEVVELLASKECRAVLAVKRHRRALEQERTRPDFAQRMEESQRRIAWARKQGWID